MKPIVLSFVLLLSCFAHCQTSKKQSLEFSFQLRREKQADYTTRIGTLFYENTLQLYGTSIGFDIGYKRFFKETWFVKPAVGYYQFTIDKIINHHIPARPNDPSRFRFIDYNPDSLPIGYSTGKYHYNNFLLGLALGKTFKLNKGLALTTDVSFSYLTTFSQHYQVGDKVHVITDKGKFGFLLDYKVGIEKEFRNLYLASGTVIPVYKKWKKDIILFENPNDNNETWFNGYGLWIMIGKYINK